MLGRNSSPTPRLDVGLPEEVFDLDGRARQVEMDSFATKIRDSLVQEDQDLAEALKEVPIFPRMFDPAPWRTSSRPARAVSSPIRLVFVTNTNEGLRP